MSKRKRRYDPRRPLATRGQRSRPVPLVNILARLLALRIAAICDPPGPDAFDRAVSAHLAREPRG